MIGKGKHRVNYRRIARRSLPRYLAGWSFIHHQTRTRRTSTIWNSNSPCRPRQKRQRNFSEGLSAVGRAQPPVPAAVYKKRLLDSFWQPALGAVFQPQASQLVPNAFNPQNPLVPICEKPSSHWPDNYEYIENICPDSVSIVCRILASSPRRAPSRCCATKSNMNILLLGDGWHEDAVCEGVRIMYSLPYTNIIWEGVHG